MYEEEKKEVGMANSMGFGSTRNYEGKGDFNGEASSSSFVTKIYAEEPTHNPENISFQDPTKQEHALSDYGASQIKFEQQSARTEQQRHQT